MLNQVKGPSRERESDTFMELRIVDRRRHRAFGVKCCALESSCGGMSCCHKAGSCRAEARSRSRTCSVEIQDLETLVVFTRRPSSVVPRVSVRDVVVEEVEVRVLRVLEFDEEPHRTPRTETVRLWHVTAIHSRAIVAAELPECCIRAATLHSVSGHTPTMNRYHKPGGSYGGPSKASGNTLCQKCLKRGHYSYECKASAQERPYIARPSRTQQLLNPKLVPKLTSDVPNDLLRK